MSYVRRPRRVPIRSYPVRPSGSLGGVQSQPTGPRVQSGSLVSLGGVQSLPRGLPVTSGAMVSMGSLGADDQSITSPTLVDPETRAYRERSLRNQEELIAAQRRWAEGDKTQKWIQIAATVMIPVTAAIWRMIGVGRRRTPT